MVKKIWNYMCARSHFIPSSNQFVLGSAICLGIYHTGLLALYAFYGMMILTVVNVFSVLIYMGCAIAARYKVEPIYIFRVFYAEIVLQVLIAGAMLGSQCGFEFYLIAITCHAFHTGYMYRNSSKINAMHYVLIDAAAFIVFRLWTVQVSPVYYFRDDWVPYALYTFNYYSAVAVIVMSMSTLLIQIINLEGRLLQKNKDLEILSHTDALTGLVNRRGIEESYDYVMENSKMYAVVLADIDDFKKINDTYGHNTGDVVLQQVAEVFKGTVREDDIVCRWGGEEILIFLPLCKINGAQMTAERIIEKIRNLSITSSDNRVFHFTMTFGVADSEEGGDLWGVIQKADDRLYRGKAQGKNCIVSEGGQSN